ncbi:MAG: alkylhydroperoxidase [Bacteroidota bacterium]
MSWIKTINYEKANSKLKRVFDKVKGPDNNIDNVLMVHSLRPHSLVGHMTLYKNILHNSGNTIPKWYLEALGVYTSKLNFCDYCVKHHFTGFKRLLNNNTKADDFLEAVTNNALDNFFDAKLYQGFVYAKKLTLDLENIIENDVIELRKVGFNDGEILEINQVVSYFNYVNRTVVGLGVNLKGDILGLSPNNSNDPDQWNHQ